MALCYTVFRGRHCLPWYAAPSAEDNRHNTGAQDGYGTRHTVTPFAVTSPHAHYRLLASAVVCRLRDGDMPQRRNMFVASEFFDETLLQHAEDK